MSRCFPFPPPGYEKKIRTDDVDLLKKEKKKERKHKKDKKDKEKRESKEKREKEGHDKKHKEKDKKEKHREKKKDKDKERDRDKSKTSTDDGKGLPGQVDGLSAGKLQKEIKHDKNGVSVDNKIIKHVAGNNGGMPRENNHLVEENKNPKFVLELERRIKDEETVSLLARSSGNLRDGSEKLNDKGFDAKKIGGKGIHAEVRPFGNTTIQNHGANFHPKADEGRGFDAKKIDGKGIHTEVRPFGNTTIQNNGGHFHPKADGMPKVLGKNFDRNSEATVGGKEKVKEKKDEGKDKVKEKKEEGKEKVKKNKDDKRGEKRKHKEEKKGDGKDKERDKEKTKEHTERKTPEQNKLNGSNNVGPMHSISNSFTQISKNSHENSFGGENHKKRKEIEPNGVPRANENLPSKLPRSSSSHPFIENGRILEPCQISTPNASYRSGVVTSSAKVENNECKINGFIEAQPLVVPSNKIHAATVPTLPSIEASVKPPHPDTKYLSHIYSVPKVEWSDLDDQEWLFSSSISQERKAAVKSSEAGETSQVWADVVHLESADIIALPYVIPY